MQSYFRPAKHSLMIMFCCAVLLILNTVFQINRFGIAPRELSHLTGIIFLPFYMVIGHI
ncbi:hypothetical protein [Psychromonas sp. KJ10-2]|uniref:hypothetical protein n=1 Tax=Psychromonas sp. KJ10-2 TaxID=3391822 RepID=UPI0039B6BC14